MSGGEEAALGCTAAAGEHREGGAGEALGRGLPERDPDLPGRPDGSPYPVINQARGTYTEAARRRRQGRLRRRALPRGRAPGAAAVRHGPGLPRPARRRRGQGRVAAQPQPAQARLPPRHRCRVHLEDASGAVRRLQHHKGLEATGRARGRRRGLPARAGADREGRPASSAAPPGRVPRSRRPHPTRSRVQVDLDPSQQGRGEAGRPRADHAARPQVGEGRVARLGRVASSAGKDGAPGTATIPASVRLDDPGEGARARQGAGPGGHHDQGRGERAERPGDRARREVRRRVRGRGRARRRPPRARRGEARACSTTRTDVSRSRAISPRAIDVVVPSP